MLSALLALIRAYIVARLARAAIASIIGGDELSAEDVAVIDGILEEELPGLPSEIEGVG